MSANKPKQQESGQKPGREEDERFIEKGGKNPSKRGEQQSGEGTQGTPGSPRDPGGERKNR